MPGDANERAGSDWGSGPWHTRTGKRVGREVHRDLGRVTARLCGTPSVNQHSRRWRCERALMSDQRPVPT